MTIRPATESDHDTLRELWTASQDEIGGPDFLRETWEDGWTDLSRHVADGLAFVAVDDADAIVGFVFATVPRETPDLGHVTDVYVHPQQRRRGVAGALMARIVEALREKGVAHVGLDVRVDNHGARALYDRLGFVEEERFLATSIATVLDRVAGEEKEQPSFGSTHVQTDDETSVARAVERFLPRLGRSPRTEVTPVRNGWITIFDELCDRDREAHRRFGAELSERLGVPSVALRLEEMTVVRYYLFERGRMVDEYLSVPTYFGQVSKADELSLAANPTLAGRLTGADPAQVRARVRTASSPLDLPDGPELLEQVAAVLGVETTIER
jgi:ribosomal protein S18 acetylase RimI-like enzyme